LLVERVKAVLRRAAPKDPTAVPKETDAKGRWTADFCGWIRAPHLHLEERAGTLTVTEFLILQALHAAGVVKKPQRPDDAAYDDQDLRRRSHYRQPHQAAAQEVQSRWTTTSRYRNLYGVGYRFKEI